MNFVAGTVLLGLACIDEPTIISEVVIATTSSTPPTSATPPTVNTPPSIGSDEELIAGHESTSRPAPTSKAPAVASPGPPPDTFIAVIQETNHTLSERLTFKICEKIFVRNHFIRMYELGLHTQLTIWTFSKLVESTFPSLSDMITEKLQVSADFYASSWFITLFSADLDLYSSIRVMDLFIAKGPKAIYRFGLACLNSQKTKLLDIANASEDPADGLKALRTVAVSAVADTGIEGLVLSSLVDFKFVNNRLIADLHTAGKIHGGAKLMFVTDRDSKRRSWVIAPPDDGSGRLSSETTIREGDHSDTSPTSRGRRHGGAFESEWNKDAEAIRRLRQHGQKESPKDTSSLVLSFFGKIKRSNSSKPRKNQELLRPSVVGSPSARGENGDLLKQMSPRAGMVSSPDSAMVSPRSHRRHSSHRRRESTSVKGAFKSFKKTLGSILPTGGGNNGGIGSSSKGYARTTDDSL